LPCVSGGGGGGVSSMRKLLEKQIKTRSYPHVRGTGGYPVHCMQPQSILYIFRPPYQCAPLIILGGHHQSNQRATPTGYSLVKPVPTLSRPTVDIQGGLP